MRKLLLILALVFVPSAALAQRPAVHTTVTITDTTANALIVGGAVGATAGTGGIKAGPLSITSLTSTLVGTDSTDASSSTTGAFKTAGGLGVAKALYVGTLITASGLGAHTFSASGTGALSIVLRNTTAGTGNFARIDIGNDADAALGRLFVGSSTFTTSGAFQANTFTVASNGLLNLATTGAAVMGFYTNGLLRWSINGAGDKTFGPSSHIVDGSGVPSINGSVGGTAPSIGANQASYAFSWTSGTGNTSVTIDLNRTYSSAAICTPTAANGAAVAYTTSTTQIIFTSPPNAQLIHVQCRGY